MQVIKYPRPQPGDGITYIGRPSVFGNPFYMHNEEQRAAVVTKYEAWVRKQPAVLEAIKALAEDAVLGCYCAPKACHGDVIVKIWKEQHGLV